MKKVLTVHEVAKEYGGKGITIAQALEAYRNADHCTKCGCALCGKREL